MPVDCEDSFSLNDVLKEFINLFEECLDSDTEPKSVPVQVLIKKIASSIQIQYFGGSSCDLEDLVRKMLEVDGDSSSLSKNDFITKITEYIGTLHADETKCNLHNSFSQIGNIACNSYSGSPMNSFNKMQHLDYYSNESMTHCEELCDEDKHRLENVCAGLNERIKIIEKANTSLLMERNALELSFRDALKRESDWEQSIALLQNKLKKSEDRYSNLTYKLANEEEIVKREREKCCELERRLNLNEEHIADLMEQFTAITKENVLLLKNLEDVEKKLESLKCQNNSTAESLQKCQSYSVYLQDQLEKVFKQKEAVEQELNDTYHRLRLITFLHEDLEMANNLLKDKLVNNPLVIPNEELSVVMELSHSLDNIVAKNEIAECMERRLLDDSHPDNLSMNILPLTSTTTRLGDIQLLQNDVNCNDEILKDNHQSICDKEGGYFLSDSCTVSDVDPVLVEKIEKQQFIIKELVETIANYSVEGVFVDSISATPLLTNSNDDENAASIKSDGNVVSAWFEKNSLLQHFNSVDLSDELNENRKSNYIDNECIDLRDSCYISADRLLKNRFSCSNIEDNEVDAHLSFDEVVKGKESLCSSNSRTNIDDSNSFEFCCSSSNGHFNQIDKKYGPNKYLEKDEKVEHSINEMDGDGLLLRGSNDSVSNDSMITLSYTDSLLSSSVSSHWDNCQMTSLPNIQIFDHNGCDFADIDNYNLDGHQYFTETSPILVTTQQNLFVTTKLELNKIVNNCSQRSAIGKELKDISRNGKCSSWLFNLLIGTITILFMFPIWLLIINYGNIEDQIYRINPGTCIYRSISYYNIEELIQPYIGLRWDRPPPL